MSNKKRGFMAPLDVSRMKDLINEYPREAITHLAKNFDKSDIIKSVKETPIDEPAYNFLTMLQDYRLGWGCWLEKGKLYDIIDWQLVKGVWWPVVPYQGRNVRVRPSSVTFLER